MLSSVFNQGRYRVEARVEGVEPPLVVTVDVDRPVGVGKSLELVVALEQLWPLRPGIDLAPDVTPR